LARTDATTRIDRRTKAGRRNRITSRERLLIAAAKVFAERGFERASVDEIAAEAGLSKGSLYWNFASKDDLFEALLEEHVDRRARAILNLTKEAPAGLDMSAEASRWFSELLREERQLILLSHEYWSRAARDPEIRRRYAERQAKLRRELASALESRGNELGAPPFALSPTDVATAYVALMEGLSFQRLIDPESVSDQLLGEIMALIYQGLVARAQRESEPT
jgi:AcrR family transcriptional regulator